MHSITLDQAFVKLSEHVYLYMWPKPITPESEGLTAWGMLCEEDKAEGFFFRWEGKRIFMSRSGEVKNISSFRSPLKLKKLRELTEIQSERNFAMLVLGLWPRSKYDTTDHPINVNLWYPYA